MLGKYIANETVGEVSIVGFWHEEQVKTYVFTSTVNEQVLTFSFDWDTGTITDDQTGSVWTNLGQAVSGELTGTQLESISTKPTFWMCWASQYTDSKIAHVEKSSDNETIDEDEQETE